ncbi:hypothetical protein [Aureivirga sp. CE67]|uniref:hypothetical protein n=1 Tax=Aureivirga sp. CE67 TaxID=1788983 RepID=UPI0018CB8A89|nr:hypothetical protein [Aureivirga sp. CE67]
MKCRFLLIVLSLFFISCKENKNRKIVAKWNFYKSNANHCEDDESNSPTSCVFHFKGERFLRNESYIFDDKGKIDSVYSYRVPLGVNIYSMNEYGKLMLNLDTLGFKKMREFQVSWDAGNKTLKEKDMTIRYNIFEDDKIIIKNEKELIIYELK